MKIKAASLISKLNLSPYKIISLILIIKVIKKKEKLRINQKIYSWNGCGSSQTPLSFARYAYANAAQIAPRIGPTK